MHLEKSFGSSNFCCCVFIAVNGSLFVPSFDTKVTEYLCSGWAFFLQTNFDFLTSHFWQNFLIIIQQVLLS